ncbi:MAG TPA: serine/threonine-protein kinase [Pyrinomonadaceae bacterium]|nr:serine/threonine-protein kinase [Pyrinomonadaceae bacterium]
MIEPNTLLQNRYRVVRQIGQGGMGAVYVATDERFGSTVAVKQTFFDDPALRKAFEREAHLLNHLRHTALPKVSDHFTEDAGQFLVMEFIEGSDLSELLHERGSAFPLADVLAWADELLDALEYLHTQQPPVVHRDIKPQNMKLTTRGHIALLDFGLAKGTPAQTRAQATASVFGYSRNYAPLEQIQGTGTDTRSDLYSLSATLYHLLTGKSPVDALTRASAIVNGQPDPLRPAHLVHAQVPASVGEILKRAMSQNAAHRQATASEMRAALRRAAAVLPNTARPAVAAYTKKPTTDVETLLEPTTQAAYGQASPSDTRGTTQLRPHAVAGAPLGETTITDAQGARQRRRPPAINSYAQPSHEPPPASRKSTTVLVCVALAVVAACALIAFPLMRRDDAPAADSVLKIETPRDANTDATQSAAPNATQQSDAARNNPNTSSASDTTSTQTQSRSARETPATTNQTTTGDTEATTVSDVKDGGSNAAGDESRSATPSVGGRADRSGLIIQGPNPQSGVRNTAAAEYDAQRAEELKRRQQQQQQQQQQRQPPPDEGHYGPPPPPPDGRRPPPHRPPPFP